MFEKQRQSWNLLEPRSFDTCINTIVPIIIILNCLEVDIEVLDASMETTESDDYREVLRDNRDANNVLAAMQKKVRFFYKNGQKFINSFT